MSNADKSAYPTGKSTENGQGLSKRELIAVHAMQGILSNHWCQNDYKDKIDALGWTLVAAQAVKFADALIEELQKQKQ